MKNIIKQMTLDHIYRHLPLISFDAKARSIDPYVPVLLEVSTPMDHRYRFDRVMALFVAEGEIDLKVAGNDV